MWFSPPFSSKEKLQQTSLKVLWGPLSPQYASSELTVLITIHLIFPSLNSPGKESELITKVSSRGQAIFFFTFKMGSSFARNNSIDNFKNCEGAVRITQSCLLCLPDAAARFLFFWALNADAHQPVCAEEDRTGGGSWGALRCEFSHCQSTFRPCWPREWEIYTVNQLHRRQSQQESGQQSRCEIIKIYWVA